MLTDIDLADYAVDFALQRGVTYAEARLEQRIDNEYVLKNGIPEIGEFARVYGLGIRVLVEGAMGFCSLNVLSKSAIRKRIDEAIKIARASAQMRKQPIQFSDEEAQEGKFRVSPKQNLADIDPEEKITFLIDLDKSMLDAIPQTTELSSRLLYLYDSETTKYVTTSKGAKISSFVPRLGFYSIITASDPASGETEQGLDQYGATGGWELVNNLQINEKMQNGAKILAETVLHGKSPPSGKLDVVLGYQLAGIVAHEHCGHPSEMDRILGREGAQAGESFLAGKFDTRIGSEHVTIVDDPTLEGSYGYHLYDDEGIKTRERILVDHGIFVGALHNMESAFAQNTKSNASARASAFNREPIIRMANTYIKPGDFSEEEIFEDIKQGVYIKTYTEWNIDDQRYQGKYVGRECYLIEKGELTHRIRRAGVELTTVGLFSSVDACSKTVEYEAAFCGKGEPMQGVEVWMGGPLIRLRDIQIS
ncbi:MAG: TldD/PmbA family protein [Candidatus Hodarchaeota archaeon]